MEKFDSELAQIIDHTILKPDTNWQQVEKVCDEAQKYGFASICIQPYFVEPALIKFEDSWINIATVIGFPHGSQTFVAKFFETSDAVNNGTDEIDYVINISAVKSGNWQDVDLEIAQISSFLKAKSVVLKVIIEYGLLTTEEVEKVCEICTEHDVDYVKTSTGFNAGGATVEMIKHLRNILPEQIQIKASGGIRTREDAYKLIDAGADRLGCSGSLEIIKL